MSVRQFLTRPIHAPQRVSSTHARLRHWRLTQIIMLWPTGIVAGGLCGALMNAVSMASLVLIILRRLFGFSMGH
jgi:hypothetical protein